MLLLAAEKWLTPRGREIWHHGIEPDVVVTLPPDMLPLQPKAENAMTPGQLQTSGDAQLLRVIEVLRQTFGAGGSGC